MGKFMTMPKLDMSMEEGLIVNWLVKKGDEIKRGDIVVEIETGKLSLEVDNPTADGTVIEIYAVAGDTVKVNEPIMFIGEPGEVPPSVGKKDSSEAPETESSGSASGELPGKLGPEVSPSGGAFILDIDTAAEWDLAVIGGGPGGYVCAIRAAQLGAKVVLFEKDSVGGVCLNRGCIPTKTLVRNAGLWRDIQNSGEMGISCKEPRFDWKKIMSRKDRVVKTLVSGVEGLLKQNGVEVVRAEAEPGPDGKITAAGRTFTAANIVIATGSLPADISYENDGSLPVYNSAQLLSEERLPESIVIVGGGVIGVEMASIYSAFGVKVTIVEMLDRIIAAADSEISELLAGQLRKDGAAIKTSTGFGGIKNGNVLLSDGSSVTASAVLISVGRKPASGRIISGTGISVNTAGFIETDERLRTSAENIYAIGDITGRSLLAHTASAQGLHVAENLFGEKKSVINYNAVPSCVFTNPEISWVGMTEAEAVKKGLPVKIGKVPFRAIGKALASGDTDGFVKVVADARWDEILGVHIIGAHASDLIAEAAAAIKLESTAGELASVVHAHPTLSEAVMEACEAVHGKSIHFKV